MNDNEPVFPVPAGTLQTGIAVRDWLAAIAMQGLASRGLEVKADRAMTMEEKEEELATRAYGLADAMLKTRRQNGADNPAVTPAS